MAVGRRRDVGRGVCGGGGDVYMHELQKVKCVTI